MGFNLQQVVPWGRSFEEYCAMFSLTELDLEQSIVGVGDGPAAFNAILTKRAGSIISADPVYKFSTQQIRQRIDDLFDDISSLAITSIGKRETQITYSNEDNVGSVTLARVGLDDLSVSDFIFSTTETNSYTA